MLAELRAYAVDNPLPDRVSLEIGSNRGKFISKLAGRNPDKRYLGIEIKRSLARKARKRARRKGADNADVICADANLAIPILIDDGQIEEIFILYPDPWWKKRHRKRRVIQPEFLDLLAPKMCDGGKVWIRTDVGTLADDMREILLDHDRFKAMAPEDYPLEPFPWTTRERHCFKASIPANLVYFVRV